MCVQLPVGQVLSYTKLCNVMLATQRGTGSYINLPGHKAAVVAITSRKSLWHGKSTSEHNWNYLSFERCLPFCQLSHVLMDSQARPGGNTIFEHISHLQ